MAWLVRRTVVEAFLLVLCSVLLSYHPYCPFHHHLSGFGIIYLFRLSLLSLDCSADIHLCFASHVDHIDCFDTADSIA